MTADTAPVAVERLIEFADSRRTAGHDRVTDRSLRRRDSEDDLGELLRLRGLDDDWCLERLAGHSTAIPVIVSFE